MKQLSRLLLVGLLLVGGTTALSDCPPACTFTGAAAGDQFGYSVSGAGDVSNDGFDDLIVETDYYDAEGYQAGRAYVYTALSYRSPNRVDETYNLSRNTLIKPA